MSTVPGPSIPVSTSVATLSTPTSTVAPEGVLSRPCPARFKKRKQQQLQVKLEDPDQTKRPDPVKEADLVAKQQHEERLKALKDIANKLKEDSWRYTASNPEVERLLNL